MQTNYEERRFVYNKLLITIKLIILIILVLGNFKICSLLEITDHSIIIHVLYITTVSMIVMCPLYLGYLCSKPFLILYSDYISFFEYIKQYNPWDILKWDEIDRFEKKDKFIFFKEIHVITKNPYASNYNIRIRESEYSRDYIYDVLTERLRAWNQNNGNLEK